MGVSARMLVSATGKESVEEEVKEANESPAQRAYVGVCNRSPWKESVEPATSPPAKLVSLKQSEGKSERRKQTARSGDASTERGVPHALQGRITFAYRSAHKVFHQSSRHCKATDQKVATARTLSSLSSRTLHRNLGAGLLRGRAGSLSGAHLGA